MFCAEYLEHREAMEDIQPLFYSCPEVCGFDSSRSGTEFCKGCPVGSEKKEFREAFESLLKVRMPDHWKRFDFDLLQQTLFAVIDVRELKDRWTIKTGVLIGIYDAEKERLRRIEDYNRKSTSP